MWGPFRVRIDEIPGEVGNNSSRYLSLPFLGRSDAHDSPCAVRDGTVDIRPHMLLAKEIRRKEPIAVVCSEVPYVVTVAGTTILRARDEYGRVSQRSDNLADLRWNVLVDEKACYATSRSNLSAIVTNFAEIP